jgi:steroid delta-isomerase
MPEPDRLRSVIAAYVDAVNGRDPVAIAALFTEEGIQADPASNPPNVGRDAIAAFFEGGIAASESWTFSARAVHTCGSNAAIDFEIAVLAGGTTMTIGGIEVFTIEEGGLISSVFAYWDDADLSFG